MIPYIVILLLCLLTIFAKKGKKAFLFLTIVSMIFILALRKVGDDWILYKTIFNSNYYSERFDIGFRWLMETCYKVFNENYFYLTFIVSFITILTYYFAISKTSSNKYVSLLLFVLLGFYAKSFNIMKQMMALCIAFYGVRYVVKRDLIKYSLTIFIASLFHSTALIMLPFYWISNIKINKKVITFSIIATIISFFSFDKIFQLIVSNISQYSVYNSYAIDIDAGIGTVLNVLFYSLLVLIVALKYKKLIGANPNNNYYLNICLFSLPFLILALKNNLFFRVSLYPLIYLTLLLNQHNVLFAGRNKTIIIIGLYSVMIVFYILSIYYFGGIYPYSSII